MSVEPSFQESPDFSLVLGGPLYRMFRRAHLTGPGLELLHRRIVFLWLVSWVPLAVLSLAEGHLLGGAKFSFLRDIETQVRFLVSLPILMLAEIAVHRRIRIVVKAFVERRIVIQEEFPKFYAAINSSMRVRNSVVVEIALVVFVYHGWPLGLAA